MDFLSGLLWLSLNIHFEARSEDQLDQIAVGLVTINRTKLKNKTIKEVVLEPKAFSWTNEKRSFIPDPSHFVTSIQSAYLSLLAHNFLGEKATHYHHIKVRPYWSCKMSYIGTFGSHKFYQPLVKIKPIKRKVKL